MRTVNEIKKYLEQEPFSEDLDKLLQDPRVTVQRLVNAHIKRRQQLEFKEQRFSKIQSFEKELRKQGISLIAGVDEAGRGPIAGPVVAAAVILPDNFYNPELYDSKQICSTKRVNLKECIEAEAVSIGVGIVSSEEIDKINIYQATLKAMHESVESLTPQAEHLLVDAMSLNSTYAAQSKIIKGDTLSYSIAAASIIAKTTRDAIMLEMSLLYPEYGFDSHMGYYTQKHLQALQKYGPTPIHRYSFAPVKQYHCR